MLEKFKNGKNSDNRYTCFGDDVTYFYQLWKVLKQS